MHQPQIIDFDHEAKLGPMATPSSWRPCWKIVNYKGIPPSSSRATVIVLDQNFQSVWV